DETVRLWDATLSARDLHGPEARAVVQARFDKLFFRADVVASLRGDAALGDEVRPVALELAQEWEEDPHQIGSAAVALALLPDGKSEDYAHALRGLEFACRTVPGRGVYRNGLGVCQYRTGKYREALASLKEAERLMDVQRPSRGGASVSGLAFA